MIYLVVLISSLFWVLLSDGKPESWILGVPAVFFSTWFFVQRASANPIKLQWLALVRFVPWFLWESIKGGLDVAKLALSRKGVQFTDRFVFRCRLPDPRAEVFFASCVNLVPGTATIGLVDDEIEIHTLSPVEQSYQELQTLQRRVAELFALELKEQAL